MQSRRPQSASHEEYIRNRDPPDVGPTQPKHLRYELSSPQRFSIASPHHNKGRQYKDEPYQGKPRANSIDGPTLKNEPMVASPVCEIGSSGRSRSRRISSDIMKRSSRSLSRAVSKSRQRSKSRGCESVRSFRPDHHAAPRSAVSTRRERSSRQPPQRERALNVLDLSESSLFSKEDPESDHDDSHGGHGHRGPAKMGTSSRPRVVGPPPAPPAKTSRVDKAASDSRSVSAKKTPTAVGMQSSLGSHDSHHTDSTYPSTSFNSSDLNLCVALVPYGSNVGKNHPDPPNPNADALPLPPSPKQRRHVRGASRGDLIHRSRHSSQFEEGNTDNLDSSTRSESKLLSSRNRRGHKSFHSRSKSQARRSVAGYADVQESSLNESCTTFSAIDDASAAKSRTSRRSRDLQRINLRDVQRSLSRNTRRRSSGGKSQGDRAPRPNTTSQHHDDDRTHRTLESAGRRRRSSMLSTKSKPAHEVSHHDDSLSLARRYRQVDAKSHATGTNNSTSTPESCAFKEETPDREWDDPRNSLHERRRSKSNVSSRSYKKVPSSSSDRLQTTTRSKSRSRREETIPQERADPDLLSHPAPKKSEQAPVLNLVIDDTTGCGSFSVPTLYASITGSVEKHLQLFTVQLNEPSQEFFIQTSMGLLNKIREIHPKTNILRTLSYWNGLQRRRYNDGEHSHTTKGGQLGISKTDSLNKHEVIMTLVGKYYNRDWEYDEDFHTELENFVEDALRFHACLNGLDESEVKEAQRKKRGGLRLRSIGDSVAGGSATSGSKFANSPMSGSHEDWMGKKVLCRVLEKITR
ncbi:hypothetical protein HJC23_009364 [Cyclotella cryptica]|uniref:Uncharacterized protein n=1 Tax=Cyclotella cryptica TaxID=29204 RepID=A0ABD3QZ39_9STRA|eukprot:CCRYP_002376-RA/>CCRYP_002376-RA protein AED:0.05 eAED:0.05 QI:0/-1/0/1/-1/1/1/0/803